MAKKKKTAKKKTAAKKKATVKKKTTTKKKAASKKKAAAKKKSAAGKKRTAKKKAAAKKKTAAAKMVAKEKPAAPPEAEAPPEAAAQTHPAHLHPYAESSDGELYLDYGPMPPETYDRDVLVALPIHPTRMFVYWELSGPKGRELRASGRPWVLRCHDVDSGVSLEWEVEPGVGNYYVHVEPGHRYRFELGTLSAGDFTAVGATRPQLSPRTEGRRTGTGQEWAHVLHDVGPAGVRAVRRMEVTLKKGAPDLLGLYAKSAAEMLDVPGSRSLHSRKK